MEFSFTLPSDREFDVVGFGLNAVDHLVTIPRFPVRVLPASGYLQAVAYECVNVEALSRMSPPAEK